MIMLGRELMCVCCVNHYSIRQSITRELLELNEKGDEKEERRRRLQRPS